jgi:hypothetical protein
LRELRDKDTHCDTLGSATLKERLQLINYPSNHARMALNDTVQGTLGSVVVLTLERKLAFQLRFHYELQAQKSIWNSSGTIQQCKLRKRTFWIFPDPV